MKGADAGRLARIARAERALARLAAADSAGADAAHAASLSDGEAIVAALSGGSPLHGLLVATMAHTLRRNARATEALKSAAEAAHARHRVAEERARIVAERAAEAALAERRGAERRRLEALGLDAAARGRGRQASHQIGAIGCSGAAPGPVARPWRAPHVTTIAPVTAVPNDPVPAVTLPPATSVRNTASDFGALVNATTAASDEAPPLRALRFRAKETTGEAFEAAMLVPFVAAMLPPEDSEIWGGTGGATWRGLFADALASDLARAGGVGIADIVDRTLAGHRKATIPNEGDKA